jgi:type I restriction enzyme S subunit
MTAAWPSVPLGELLCAATRRERVDPLKEYRLLGVRLDGEGPFLRETKTGSQISATTLYKVEAGDFIYSRLFAWRGAFGLIPPELDGCYVSGEFPTFRAVPNRLDLKLLRYWFRLRSTLDVVLADCTGSTPLTRNRFKEEFFLRLKIPLPSLPEQRRIVARIEELAGKVEETINLRHQSIAERVALTGSAVAALLGTAQGTGCLGDYLVDCSYGTSRKTDDDDTGTPILRMGNIQDGRLAPRNLKYLHLDSSERAKLLLKPGDIVVNRTNSADLVGKCAVFNLDYECSFASYLIRLRLDTGRADPRLVAAWINSPAGRAYMFRERNQMTGQANVNATKLKALPIALPDLAAQRRIVAELDSLQARVDELKRLQAETQAELDALLPSILDRAFKGEL